MSKSTSHAQPTKVRPYAYVGEVCDYLGCSQSTLYYWIARDDMRFPKSTLLGQRAVWKWSDVEAWVNERLAIQPV
jgi:excisionase family DNA binding protein